MTHLEHHLGTEAHDGPHLAQADCHNAGYRALQDAADHCPHTDWAIWLRAYATEHYSTGGRAA